MTQREDSNVPRGAIDLETNDQDTKAAHQEEAPGIRELNANSDVATVLRSQNTCPHCSVDLPTWGLLQQHIYRKHIRRFNCLEGSCEWAFNLKADLQRHQDTVHRSSSSVGGFTCANSWCKFPGKVWPRKDNFERHAKECKPGRHALKREKKKISSRRVRSRNV
ncbi:hypothetical protein FB567DRAFT_553151 [Paraphoma chrysanthemicola]|uniref:C2H2-type domain-containing protein n=1 Tax=Paraphoma chrysanthemicola TaxID=798071 RepID=A0A8K0QZ21_9PLEO|nr:hypothetical protein FB567DRAFT_553151 [Paraphoma chrysanthemicola]